ncbi:MAG: hypothetical protein ACK2T6_01235 [Anaerolineae bacterium]|jgi:hypothetical protein
MESSSKEGNRIIRFLVDNAHCAECGAHYHEEDVYVLGQLDLRIWDLAAVCHSCYTLSVVRAVVRPQSDQVKAEVAYDGVPADRRREVLHEMTAAEVRHFDELPPIGKDDVLDVTHFLCEFDGDFRGLFGKEPDDTP